jgi:hypothetical protein
MAQPHRALVQQAQELATGCYPLRQDRRIPHRLRQPRLSIPVAALCPRWPGSTAVAWSVRRAAG